MKIKKDSIFNIINDNRVFLINLVLILILGLTFPSFVTIRNISFLLLEVSGLGILSCAVLIIIVSGNFDLSVGSILALSGILSAKLDLIGIPLTIVFITCLIVGASIGFINGIIVRIGKVNSLIATLSTSFAVYGLVLLFSGEKTIYGLSEKFLLLGKSAFGIIPYLFFFLIFIAILSYIILQKTAFGKHIYIIGANEKAAFLHGININLHVILVYIYIGILSAFSGILFTARYTAASPMAAKGIELTVIAAIIIGGASLFGGTGTIIRTMGGILIVGIISNGIGLSNLDSNVALIFEGLIIILAVSYGFINKKIRFIHRTIE